MALFETTNHKVKTENKKQKWGINIYIYRETEEKNPPPFTTKVDQIKTSTAALIAVIALTIKSGRFEILKEL